jgi:zinc protease
MAGSVAAFTFPAVTGATVFILRGNAIPGGNAEEMERALLAELEQLREAPPSPEEMERALTAVEARQIMALQRLSERADQISMFTTHFDEPELVQTEIERYRAVSAEDVRRFALEYLGADNRAVLTYLPRAEQAAA